MSAQADRVLAIGPANFAGQAFRWARAVETHLGVRSEAFSHSPMPLRRISFGFPVDHRLPYPRLTTRGVRRMASRALLKGVSHLAVDGFMPLIGRPDRDSLGSELDSLAARVDALALIAHGSDVRDPQRHIERIPHSYFGNAPEPWVQLLGDRAETNRVTAAAFKGPVFVSTPDLLLDLPQAQWLPLTIDTKVWQSGRPTFTRRRPVVVHIPSRRTPPIKGTEFIDPILRSMHQEGRIEYVSPLSVPHEEMAAIVRDADIVVDQILTGSYGAAAVEAMAAGRLVVGNVAPDVRALMDEEPPIVDASAADFAEVMDGLLADAARYAGVAASGVEFAAKWHDGRAAAAALSGFLGV